MFKKLTEEEKLLLKILGFYVFGESLAGVFLNLYLFRLSGLKAAVLLDLVALITLFLVYVASGFILRKYNSRTLMALGVFGSAFFYLLVYILKENSLHFLVPLGFVAGLASGCYWVGNNLSSYILTQEKTRNLFFG